MSARFKDMIIKDGEPLWRPKTLWGYPVVGRCRCGYPVVQEDDLFYCHNCGENIPVNHLVGWGYVKKKKRGPKISVIFRPYDLWIGLYYDQKRKIVYIFGVPMLGIKIKLSH